MSTERKMSVAELVSELEMKKPEDLKAFISGMEPKSPSIRLNAVITAKISMTAMYFAYYSTFNTKRLIINDFIDYEAKRVLAIQDTISGAWVWARIDKKTGDIEMILSEDPNLTIPMITVTPIVQIIMERNTDTKSDLNLFILGGKDIEWEKNPDIWAIEDQAQAVNESLKRLGNELKKRIDEMKATVTLKKTTDVRQLYIPVGGVPCKDPFHLCKSIEEYEKVFPAGSPKGRKRSGNRTFAEALTSFRLMSDDEMTEEQKMLVLPSNDPMLSQLVFERWYFSMLKAIINPLTQTRNILLFGPAGTGKSTSSNIVAWGTGLPKWQTKVCSSEMTAQDLLGGYQIIDGKPTYVMSSLMKAVRYGGVIEIQEPSCIRDPGTMTVLNDILDPTSIIEIPETQESFRRHPNCIIILTTNLDYAGCRQINQSILSRMHFIKFIPSLNEKDYINRVSLDPKVKIDTKLLQKMAKAYVKVVELAQTDSLYGDTSYRTFHSWVLLTQVLGNAVEAAENTVICKVDFSSDQEEKSKIKTILESILQDSKAQIPMTEVDEALSELEAFVR